jgi:limonene 1,2-monooxygenase
MCTTRRTDLSRLRFGIFLPPYHNPRHSTALAIERDLQLAEHLDRLGYDEIWFGEHHSGGYETIPAPELDRYSAEQAPAVHSDGG